MRDDNPPRDLTSLALTCRFLSEPAFDTLWHNLRDIAPLLCTFPKDLWSQLMFLRAPARQDFARFSMYSRRVKKLGDWSPRDPVNGESPSNDKLRYLTTSSHHIPSLVWDFLFAFGPKPLLPGLQFLSHEEMTMRPDINYRKTPIHFADLLFGPTLKKVDISYIGPCRCPERANDLARILSAVAPALESLKIKAIPTSHTCRIGDSLHWNPQDRLFQGLKNFNVRDVAVAPDTLMALGKLPCLESLLLHVESADYRCWDSLPHERSAGLFPALRKVAFYHIDVEWCTAFLHILSSPSLQKVCVRCGSDQLPPSSLLEVFCSAVSQLPSARSIVDLFITVGATTPPKGKRAMDREMYSSSTFAPLHALSALERLRVKGQCITILHDLTLDIMSHSWPNIVELVFEWDRNARPRPHDVRWPDEDDDFPYPTSLGLLYFARRSTHPTKLAVAVDWTYPSIHAYVPRELHSTPLVHLSGPAVCPLREFDTSGSVLYDDYDVAVFLSLAFPQLSEISDCFEAEDWADIKTLYSWFVRVRAQERACAGRNGRQFPGPDLRAEIWWAPGYVDGNPDGGLSSEL
ncbi:uncharacterized protein TRAVEDRAFT_46645 [Trametes versicolor FP-101664 SS1]|uniref:uncharacterized protein n=1 Tax=Trametes versicolor (strain FP-101664) TaxID=717944 RepID=UPI00046232B3|nr:uncharacterized protein TRAVEDRAFT_46645 [Trametes versicolor FP-101664 SS1]EIW59340.1 hypothetical protein TRAVEDRAFT_46645 [Trametes versicolor FP-101664 SS1]